MLKHIFAVVLTAFLLAIPLSYATDTIRTITMETKQLSNGNDFVANPTISGNYVSWASGKDRNNLDIFLLNLENNELVQLTDSQKAIFSVVRDGYVMYNENNILFSYDIDKKLKQKVTGPVYAGISKNYIVYTNQTSTNSWTFLFDSSNGITKELTDIRDQMPVYTTIHGTYPPRACMEYPWMMLEPSSGYEGGALYNLETKELRKVNINNQWCINNGKILLLKENKWVYYDVQLDKLDNMPGIDIETLRGRFNQDFKNDFLYGSDWLFDLQSNNSYKIDSKPGACCPNPSDFDGNRIVWVDERNQFYDSLHDPVKNPSIYLATLKFDYVNRSVHESSLDKKDENVAAQINKSEVDVAPQQSNIEQLDSQKIVDSKISITEPTLLVLVIIVLVILYTRSQNKKRIEKNKLLSSLMKDKIFMELVNKYIEGKKKDTNFIRSLRELADVDEGNETDIVGHLENGNIEEAKSVVKELIENTESLIKRRNTSSDLIDSVSILLSTYRSLDDFIDDFEKLFKLAEKRNKNVTHEILLDIILKVTENYVDEINEDFANLIFETLSKKFKGAKLSKEILLKSVVIFLLKTLGKEHDLEGSIPSIKKAVLKFGFECSIKEIEETIKSVREEAELEDFEEDISKGHSKKLEDFYDLDGHGFEKYLEKFFRAKGYEVVKTPVTGDQGADLIIKKDGEKTAVQAKKYSGNVGNWAVQEVFSAKTYYKTDKAMVITNSNFTESAAKLAIKTGVELWDGKRLKSEIRKLT